MDNNEYTGFEPVFDENCRILILGSFPSVRSRQEGFYYGNPQNRFWRVLSTVLGEPEPLSIQEKKTLLLKKHIALWDAARSCIVEGSADSSIRAEKPVDLSPIMKTASVERVLCNGATAGKLYKKYLQNSTEIEATVLPSTSPANAAWSFMRLCDVWEPALKLNHQHK